ncbi:MAG: hypothetical protein BRC58_09910 [Cyanobacteria bacterium QS_8_64_29]|nr:MAG: hypothetical protein BRC58_09910 [Cyanobacteria bacterium QS_8_64_29]
MANASAARPQPPRQERIRCPKLSLAVYCEVAAHLRQVEGVQAELIPQQAQQFDYERSQTLGLRLTYSAELDGESKQRAEAILAYYARHYGPWQRRSLDAESD